MKYKIYTDGACSNNGKENPVGGSAYVVLDEKENIILEKAFKIEPATNNICELKALIEGCSAISSILRFNDSVIVYSDSAYCINAYKQNWVDGWIRRGWITSARTPVKNRELWEQLYEFFIHPSFTFEKVKGHTGEKDWNDYVDKKAVEAKNFTN